MEGSEKGSSHFTHTWGSRPINECHPGQERRVGVILGAHKPIKDPHPQRGEMGGALTFSTAAAMDRLVERGSTRKTRVLWSSIFFMADSDVKGSFTIAYWSFFVLRALGRERM